MHAYTYIHVRVLTQRWYVGWRREISGGRRPAGSMCKCQHHPLDQAPVLQLHWRCRSPAGKQKGAVGTSTFPVPGHRLQRSNPPSPCREKSVCLRSPLAEAEVPWLREKGFFLRMQTYNPWFTVWVVVWMSFRSSVISQSWWDRKGCSLSEKMRCLKRSMRAKFSQGEPPFAVAGCGRRKLCWGISAFENKNILPP